jgi:hypothetical protein
MLRDRVYGLRDSSGLPAQEKLSPYWNQGDPSRFPRPEVVEEAPSEFEGAPVFKHEAEWLHGRQ